MIPRGANRFAARRGEAVDGLHPHIHQGLDPAPDDAAGVFVERGDLVAGLDAVNADFVVEVVVSVENF